MSTLALLILISCSLFIILLIIVISINFRKIDSFFHPNKYNYIEMMQLDNTIEQWIQPKTKDLTFKFNDGIYNMFYQGLTKDELGMDQMIRTSALYKEGRLSKFYYTEGNEDPIDFRTGEITGNPQIKHQTSKINLTDLIMTEDSIMEKLFKDYGLFIFLGLVLLIIVIVWVLFGRPPTETVQQVPK